MSGELREAGGDRFGGVEGMPEGKHMYVAELTV